MSFLDFAEDLNYNLKGTELKEEALFLKNNKVQRVKEQIVVKSNNFDEKENEREDEVLR